MRLMRLRLAIVLAGVALLGAACGGGGGSSGASSSSVDPSGAASLGPKDAGAWADIDVDRASAQWKALDAALARVPGAEQLINGALAQIGSGKNTLDFQRDIQPALGKEVVVALPAGSSDPVLLVNPADEAKLEALLRQSTTPPVTGKLRDWTVVAQTQKALDAYRAALAQGTLADDDVFTKAMEGLPSPALARVFINGKGLAAALNKATGTASGALKNGALKNLPAGGLLPIGADSSLSVSPKTLAQIGTIGLAVSAGDHLLRVDGSIQPANGAVALSYTPTLLDRVPGDAFAAISFAGDAARTKQIRAALDSSGGTDALKQVQQTLGVSLDDLLGLAESQAVFYVRPGLVIPEITAVLEPKDPAHALQTIDTAIGKLAATTGGAKITETTQGGVKLKQVTVSIVSVLWGRDGDRIVVTTGAHAIADFDGSDAKLVATARFKKAAADVGLVGKTGGFAYVDVSALGPLLNTIAAATGSTPDPSLKKATDALSAIESAAVNSTVDGSRIRFQGAVRVG